MSIVLSSSIVLSPTTNPLNTPIFGWNNIAAEVTATSEAAGFPASNVTNPITHLRWKAAEVGSPPGPSPSDEYMTVTIDQVDPIDYLAIAVHNFASAQIAVSIEGATEMVGSPEEPDWFELVQDTILPNDGPALFRFTPQALIGIRLRMQPGTAVPFVGVMYAGKLLVAERGTHTDQVPINFGRTSRVMNGKSETGQFLGRIVLSQSLSGSFNLKLLRSAWYRSTMDPFVIAAQETPFFWAWKPQEFPNDVGFVWMTNDVQPTINFDTGRVSVVLQMAGVSV